MSHQSVLARLDQKNASCPAPSQSPVQSSSGICIKQEYFEDQHSVTVKTESESPSQQHNIMQSIKVEVKKEEELDDQNCPECVVKRELDFEEDEQMDTKRSVKFGLRHTTLECSQSIAFGTSSSLFAPPQSTSGIYIKQEYFDEPSDNGQQMDKDDNPDTNSHNVTVNIKTEPMDCDFVVVKQEIKEEDDEDTSTNTNQVTVKSESIDEDVKVELKEEDDNDDDCDGCVRCLVKKEEVSDDDEVDHDEGELIRGGEHEHDEVDQPSSNQPIDSNEVMNQEIGLVDEGEDKSDLGGDDEMPNTTNDNHDGAMVVSNEASSSARARSNRVTSKQSTGSTVHNVNKRKQTRTNRNGKRSKKTVEVGDDESGDDGDEDIATDDQVDDKIKVINVNCTEENCDAKLNSLDQLYGHLLAIHGHLPHRCFAQNCNARCVNRRRMAVHMKGHHSNATRFVCHVSIKVYASQNETYVHWNQCHLTGQFECNLNECSQMFATRKKVLNHQLYKHCPESKRFECAHDGCSSSFVLKNDLARHELTHLATRPFHFTWPQCRHSTKQRSNLLTHIRMKHFGLPRSVKEQMDKKIEDNRDANEYVRVVE